MVGGTRRSCRRGPRLPGTAGALSRLLSMCFVFRFCTISLHAGCPAPGEPLRRGPAQPFIGQLHPLQTDYVPVPGPGSPCELAAVGSTHFLSCRTRPCFLAGCWPGPVHRLQRWLPPTSCSQHSCSLSSRRTAGRVCHLPSSAFEDLGLHRTHLDNLCVLRSPDLGFNVCKIPSQTYPNESLSA